MTDVISDCHPTKSCDVKERVVPREEAEAWARSKGMLFLEASAKTQVAIKQVFTEVVRKVGTG